MAGSSSTADDGLCVLRVPHRKASIHYRAYSERLNGISLLDWTIQRLRAGAPSGMRFVCVCETEGERDRMRAACGLPHPVEICVITARDEIDLCRLAIERYKVGRLIVAGFSHAIAPEGFACSVGRLHTALGAAFTDTSGGTFADPLFIIESSMVDYLLTAPLPNMPSDVIPGVEYLAAARKQFSHLVRDFVWLRIALPRHVCVSSACWPEKIALESARDVDQLREAVAATSSPNGQHSLIEAWKATAIAIRQRRLSHRPPRSRIMRVDGRRPVRILYASNGSGFTGAQQSLCHLIGSLDRTRFEPLAVVSYSGTFSDELRRRDVKVICPDESIGNGDIDNVVWAHRIIATWSPDLIHANHNIGMPLTAAAIATGVPLVQHVRVQTPRVIDQQIQAADAVIAVSNFVRNKIAELDVDLNKVEVIWNGVNVEHFTPRPDQAVVSRQRLGIQSGDFVVAMIARMARSKRHDTVIAAVSRMRNRLGRGHLLLVGGFDGDRAYSHTLRQQIEQEQLADHCSVIEFSPDIRQILYASDIVAIPSEEEPLSRAALEAMAMALPVVVSDSGGTKEVVDHGRTGLVVPCGDIVSLAEAFCELNRKADLVATLGRAAAEKVRTSLTSEICAEKTMEVYDRVLRGDYARLATRQCVSDMPPWSGVS